MKVFLTSISRPIVNYVIKIKINEKLVKFIKPIFNNVYYVKKPTKLIKKIQRKIDESYQIFHINNKF